MSAKTLPAAKALAVSTALEELEVLWEELEHQADLLSAERYQRHRLGPRHGH